MKYSKEEIGKRIKEERLKLNWSQKGLGEELNQHSGAKQVSLYENGKLMPPMDVLLKLCDIFNCELGYLLGEEEYSDKTKLDTEIEKTLGLNQAAMNNLKKIVGRKTRDLSYADQKGEHKKVLNSFISASSFLELMEALYDLEILMKDHQEIWDEFHDKYGMEISNQAWDYYNSEIDYLAEKNNEEIDDIYIEAIQDIEARIEKSYDIMRKVKISRYELYEEFMHLLDELYPKINKHNM